MDRRFGVITAVLMCEILFRLAYRTFDFRIDPLIYTLCARLFELFVILDYAYAISGIKARSIRNEVIIGLSVSGAFGAAVVVIDLLSRFAMPGGVLKMMIGRQEVLNPLLFFLAACLIGPFVEELFFRGLFYTWLRQRLPVPVCVLLSAVAFAGMHGFISPVQLVGGLLFAVLFEWRKNIWAPYIVHVAANTGIWILPWVHPLW